MATRTIAGKEVQVNDEGYLTNPAEWTPEVAACGPECVKHLREHLL